MHHKQAGYPWRNPRTVDGMMRTIAFIVAAAALLLVLWWLFWGLVHTLILAFWVVLVVLIGVGLFRVSRRSSRRTR
jgi:Flp pilus assembly protein TadB